MRGFTLVELLVIIGIMVILAALAFPVFRIFQQESVLNDSAEAIIDKLRLAQNKTLASEGGSQWGVYFDNAASPHEYTLFKGQDYLSRDPSFDQTQVLPKSIDIYEINLAGGESEAVFKRVSGETGQYGNLSLRMVADPEKTKTIYIEPFGQASLSDPPVPSDADRIKDSRHIHFDLGWSIQNAVYLKFQFLGPEPDQIEIIDMADYFNADKTEFDWNNEDNPFLVNGAKQAFRIHTHSLDAFNALLCIHRDRSGGKNTEEVIVYIVENGTDKDIVYYLADIDDASQEGSYVFNSMERQ